VAASGVSVVPFEDSVFSLVDSGSVVPLVDSASVDPFVASSVVPFVDGSSTVPFDEGSSVVPLVAVSLTASAGVAGAASASPLVATSGALTSSTVGLNR